MRYFIDSSIRVKKLHVKSGDRTVYSVTSTAVATAIQTTDPTKQQFNEGIIGKVFRVWTPLAELPFNRGIRNGDQLVVRERTVGLDPGDMLAVQSHKVVDFGSTQYVEIIAVLREKFVRTNLIQGSPEMGVDPDGG